MAVDDCAGYVMYNTANAPLGVVQCVTCTVCNPLQAISPHLLSHLIFRHPFFTFDLLSNFSFEAWFTDHLPCTYPLLSLPLDEKNATALSSVFESICIQGLQNSHRVELQLILCTGLLPDSEILKGKSQDITVCPVSSTDLFCQNNTCMRFKMSSNTESSSYSTHLKTLF